MLDIVAEKLYEHSVSKQEGKGQKNTFSLYQNLLLFLVFEMPFNKMLQT